MFSSCGVVVRPAKVTSERVDVLVSAHLRKCVVFIGIKDDGHFKPRATGFFVGYTTKEGVGFNYLVTAEHVISGLITRGYEIWVRVNMENGEGGELKTPAEWWKFHPDETQKTDVAIASLSDRASRDSDGAVLKFDYRRLPMNGPNQMVATKEVIAARGIGIGEEIAIVGLFRSHFGAEINIPIVRIGNIATMQNEPVFTEYAGYIDAYLVEARSIGGLSGSPVLVNIAPYRSVEGSIQSGHGLLQYYLLGLMHGHFDVKNLRDDAALEDDGVTGGINTGIGVVVPVEKILETLEHPDLVSQREEIIMNHKQSDSAATPDLDVSASSEVAPKPESDANPDHLEDFTRLVSAASKRKPKGDRT